MTMKTQNDRIIGGKHEPRRRYEVVDGSGRGIMEIRGRYAHAIAEARRIAALQGRPMYVRGK